MKTAKEILEKHIDYVNKHGIWNELLVKNIEEAMEEYADQFKVKNLAQRDVIKSLSDLDGKTIPVRFTVKKWQPNIHLDDI